LKVALPLLTLALFVAVGCAAKSKIAVRPEQLTIAPLAFNPPKAERYDGPNGMGVYLLTDKELPLVEINAWIRIGSIYEPAGKVGLARLAGEVMRTGGTKSMAPNALDEGLEFLAASVESGIGEEFGHVSMSCLKKDLPRVFALFSQVIQAPAYDPQRVELARNQLLEAIRRRNDNPEEVLRREFRTLLFGKDSPWARTPNAEDVKKIAREDLIEFHKRYIAPDRVLLAVSGDITRAELDALLDERFGGWQVKGAPLPPVAPLGADPPASVNLVDLKKSQSEIRVGHRGPRRGDPDEAVFEAFNEIFGGGMTSRLYADIRSTRGLAYSVYGFLLPGRDRGFFITSAGTKAGSTAETVAALIAQIRGLNGNPPTAKELEESRSALINQFVFNYDSPGKIVNRRAELELMGYPPDYLETWLGRVRAVTVEDLRRVIAKTVRPDNLIVLVVGDPKAFDKPLDQFGTARKIEIEPAFGKKEGS